MWLAQTVSWRQAALFTVDGAFGIVLYHAQFGFTSAYRVFISERRAGHDRNLDFQERKRKVGTFCAHPTSDKLT